MSATLLAAGIVCIVAAILGGGLKALGFDMPILNSIIRQWLLGIVGIIFFGVAFYLSSAVVADKPEDPVTKNTPVPPPHHTLPPEGLPPVVPPPTQISFPASSIDMASSQNVEIGGGLLVYGSGLLHTGPPYNRSVVDDVASYVFSADADGQYELSITYASAESRPVEIVINGASVTKNGMSESTGGYLPQNQQTLKQLAVHLNKGANIMKLERMAPFPHISKFQFDPL